MIRVLMACLAVMALIDGCVVAHVENREAAQGTQARKENPILRHVVLLAFKDGTTPEQVKAIVDAFCDLPCKIDVIAGFEWGTDVSPERKSEGFTHCFLLTFRSAADRDAYLVHPAHKEFGGALRPHLGKVLVVDSWARS